SLYPITAPPAFSSFPTRRSSDLGGVPLRLGAEGPAGPPGRGAGAGPGGAGGGAGAGAGPDPWTRHLPRRDRAAARSLAGGRSRRAQARNLPADGTPAPPPRTAHPP